MKKLFPAAFILTLSCTFVLTGCQSEKSYINGQPAQSTTSSASYKQPSASQPLQTTSATSKKSGDGSITSAAHTNTDSGSTKKQADPLIDKPVQKLYHMNKNYFIIPNDPKKTDSKVVLLSFDDGPDKKENLVTMFKVLKKHHAKAIFFDIGQLVKAHPDLFKYTVDQGGIIGNHTWDHPFLSKLTHAQINQELEKTQALDQKTAGVTPHFFRPPYADSNAYVREKVKKDGMLFMTWSNGDLDWTKPMRENPQLIVQTVMKQLHPGSIILMHEHPWTVSVLDQILTEIDKKGYHYVDPRSIDINWTTKKS